MWVYESVMFFLTDVSLIAAASWRGQCGGNPQPAHTGSSTAGSSTVGYEDPLLLSPPFSSFSFHKTLSLSNVCVFLISVYLWIYSDTSFSFSSGDGGHCSIHTTRSSCLFKPADLRDARMHIHEHTMMFEQRAATQTCLILHYTNTFYHSFIFTTQAVMCHLLKC